MNERQIDIVLGLVRDEGWDSPAAISLPFGLLPFGSLPANSYIRGQRYRVMFDRISDDGLTATLREPLNGPESNQ